MYLLFFRFNIDDLIVVFLIVNVVNATTKTPTIYIELIDSTKLANMLGKPVKFVPLKRQVSSNPSADSQHTSSLFKTNDKHENKNNNIQTFISKSRELDMKLDKQEIRKREKVGKRLLLGTCLKEGKAELQMMHELMKARQLRMNHSIVPFTGYDNQEFLNSLDNDIDMATGNPNLFIDLVSPDGLNVVEAGPLRPSLPMPPLMNLPPAHDYIANKPYPIYQEYPVPNFYWPSQDIRPFQSAEPTSRLFKRYGNLSSPLRDSYGNPYNFIRNRFNAYSNNPPSYLPQMSYTPN